MTSNSGCTFNITVLPDSKLHSTRSAFYTDVVHGLSQPHRAICSKYLYDDHGSNLYDTITTLDEYYLTRTELEILQQYADDIISNHFNYPKDKNPINIIELGSGSSVKITHFLKALLRRHINFEYIPVDISKDALDNLFTTIRTTLPEAHFTISAIAGEYLPALQHVLKTFPNRRNAIVFLGSNLGNFSPPQIPRFLSSLSAPLSSGDLLLLGCDLQKDMSTMLSAYNDSRGVTRDFNLNLLTRINRELGANFHLANFSYHSTFNSHTSAIESYIISSIDQTVSLNPIHEIVPDTSSTVTLPARQFSFKAGDAINTETSQKYTSDFLRKILYSSGFTVAEMFMDRRAWFTDIVARVR